MLVLKLADAFPGFEAYHDCEYKSQEAERNWDENHNSGWVQGKITAEGDVSDAMEEMMDNRKGVDHNDEACNSHKVDNVEYLHIFRIQASMGIAYHDVPNKPDIFKISIQ